MCVYRSASFAAIDGSHNGLELALSQFSVELKARLLALALAQLLALPGHLVRDL